MQINDRLKCLTKHSVVISMHESNKIFCPEGIFVARYNDGIELINTMNCATIQGYYEKLPGYLSKPHARKLKYSYSQTNSEAIQYHSNIDLHILETIVGE